MMRHRSLHAPIVAATLALAFALLAGCSSSAGPGDGSVNTKAGNGAEGSAEASAASAPSATGYDGALLPAGLHPHEFSLTDQHGRHVALRDFKGRVTILAFLYTTSKTTAPLIAQQIRGALDELGASPPNEPHPSGSAPGSSSREAQVAPALAISVDPTGDTRSRVQAFLRAMSLTGRMEYLSGTAAQLRPVWRAYAAVPASDGASAYERSAFVLLLDRTGAPRVELPVEELTPEALAHDVRRLERE